jgi:hypothetical protein
MNKRKGSLSLGSTLSNYPVLLIMKGRFAKSLCSAEALFLSFFRCSAT